MKVNSKIKLIALSVALSASMEAFAGLGGLRVNSSLGQPFSGSIVVTGDEAAHLINGGKLSLSDGRLKASVQKAGNNAVIYLNSSQSINDPVLIFNMGVGSQARQYAAIIDPAGYRAAETAPRTSKAGESAKEREKTKTAAPKAPAAKVTAPKPAQQATPRRTPAPAAAPATAPAATTNANNTIAPGTYTIRKGEDLSKIAARIRPEGLSVRQTLSALLKANPELVKKGKADIIVPGTVVNIPTPQDLAALATGRPATAAPATSAPQPAAPAQVKPAPPAPQPPTPAEAVKEPAKPAQPAVPVQASAPQTPVAAQKTVPVPAQAASAAVQTASAPAVQTASVPAPAQAAASAPKPKKKPAPRPPVVTEPVEEPGLIDGLLEDSNLPLYGAGALLAVAALLGGRTLLKKRGAAQGSKDGDDETAEPKPKKMSKLAAKKAAKAAAAPAATQAAVAGYEDDGLDDGGVFFESDKKAAPVAAGNDTFDLDLNLNELNLDQQQGIISGTAASEDDQYLMNVDWDKVDSTDSVYEADEPAKQAKPSVAAPAAQPESFDLSLDDSAVTSTFAAPPGPSAIEEASFDLKITDPVPAGANNLFAADDDFSLEFPVGNQQNADTPAGIQHDTLNFNGSFSPQAGDGLSFAGQSQHTAAAPSDNLQISSFDLSGDTDGGLSFNSTQPAPHVGTDTTLSINLPHRETPPAPAADTFEPLYDESIKLEKHDDVLSFTVQDETPSADSNTGNQGSSNYAFATSANIKPTSVHGFAEPAAPAAEPVPVAFEPAADSFSLPEADSAPISAPAAGFDFSLDDAPANPAFPADSITAVPLDLPVDPASTDTLPPLDDFGSSLTFDAATPAPQTTDVLSVGHLDDSPSVGTPALPALDDFDSSLEFNIPAASTALADNLSELSFSDGLGSFTTDLSLPELPSDNLGSLDLNLPEINDLSGTSLSFNVPDESTVLPAADVGSDLSLGQTAADAAVQPDSTFLSAAPQNDTLSFTDDAAVAAPLSLDILTGGSDSLALAGLNGLADIPEAAASDDALAINSLSGPDSLSLASEPALSLSSDDGFLNSLGEAPAEPASDTLSFGEIDSLNSLSLADTPTVADDALSFADSLPADDGLSWTVGGADNTADTAFSIEAPAAVAAPETDAAALNWDDINLGEVSESSTASGFVTESVGMTAPLEAKFELAEMYIEIGDPDAARETLRELIEEADGEILAKSKALLDTL